MRADKKRILTGAGILALMLVVAVLGFNWKQLMTPPTATGLPIDSAYAACTDAQGNYFVLDSGMLRILSMDKNGVFRYAIEGETALAANGFFSAKHIAADEEGYLYVADVRPYDEKVGLQILCYKPDGRLDEIVWQQAPGEVGTIDAMRATNRVLTYAYTHDGLTDMMRWDVHERVLTHVASFKGHDQVNAYAISPTADATLYFTTMKGDLWRVQPDGSAGMIYDGHAALEDFDRSIVRGASVTGDGTVYFADNGSRTIRRLLPDGTTQDITPGRVGDVSPVEQKPVLNTVCALMDGGVITVSGEGISHGDAQGELLFEGSEARYGAGLLSMRWGLWALAGLLALVLLAAVLRMLIARRGRRMNETGKIALGVSLFAVVVSIAVIAILPANIRENNNALIMENIRNMAFMASKLGIGDDVERITSIDDYQGESYNRVKAELDQLVDDRGRMLTEMYYMLYVTDERLIISLIDSTGYVNMFEAQPKPYEGSDTQVYNYGQGIQMDYDTFSDETGDWTFSVTPIRNSAGKVVGIVEIGVDSYEMRRSTEAMITELLILLLTMVVIVFMVYNEVLQFGQFFSRRREARLTRDVRAAQESSALSLRTLTFLMYTAFSLQSAFVPILASRLYVDFLGLPSAVAIAIPVSASLFTTSIFGIVGGYLIGRIGVRTTLIVGSAIVAGSFASIGAFMSFEALTFGRLCSGVGMGLISVSINTLASASEDEAIRSKGFTSYNTGMNSGLNIGIVLGAQLVGWIGYSNIYYAAAALLLGIVAYVAVYVPHTVVQRKVRAGDAVRAGSIGISRFLLNRRVWSFFLCVFLPYTVASYFLYYFFPLFADAQGMSEANIGRFYLLAGLIVVNSGPALTNGLIRVFGVKMTNIIANVSYALVFALFAAFPSIEMAIASVVLLSLLDSFGFSAQSIYYAGLAPVARYGAAKAMGIFSMVENIAQTAAPFLFSAGLMLGNSAGMLAIGGSVVALVPLFAILSRRTRAEEAYGHASKIEA